MSKDSDDRDVLELKIAKYRALARQAPDDLTQRRINALVVELEQRQREIEE